MFANDDGATERNYFKTSVILQGFLKISNHLMHSVESEEKMKRAKV